MAIKNTLWAVCIVSSVVLVALYIFFTLEASTIISETGVKNKIAPLETFLWMFSFDNPFFIFVLLLFIAATASFGILKFHPAFRTPAVSSIVENTINATVNAANSVLPTELNKQVGGFLRRLRK